MRVFVRAVVAFSVAVAAPASAALFQYDFTAGGPGSYSQAYSQRQGFSPTQAFYYTSENEGNFSMTARFVVDTAKAGRAGTVSVIPGTHSYYDTYSGGEPFMTPTVTKTGTLPVPLGAANGRSYLYANTDWDEFSLYQEPSDHTQYDWKYEYHENGSLARQFYVNGYVNVYLTGALADWAFGEVDGLQIVTSIAPATPGGGSGYIQSHRHFIEYLFDEAGNNTALRYEEESAYAHITSATASPVAVPEPAALSLFGLGLLGLAARRRRKAA